MKELRDVARALRKLSTDTEVYLWRYLRDRQIEGFKFRRQQPVGSYVVDFVNLGKKVVIELDGGQHALHPGVRIRDEWLRGEGYQVLRFTPHPDPLPCLRRSGYAQAGPRGYNF